MRSIGRCTEYAIGASPTTTDGLCQKKGTATCYPRNYAGDKKIGNSEFYGCPEDMCASTPLYPH